MQMHRGPSAPHRRHFGLRPLQELTRHPQTEMLGALVGVLTGLAKARCTGYSTAMSLEKEDAR